MNKKLSLRVFKFCIFALIIFDLWLFGSKYIVANEVNKCYWDRKIVGFLKEQGQPYAYRVMSPHTYGPFSNKAWLDGIHMIDGYDGITLKRYADLMNRASYEAIDSPRNLKLLGMANLKFILMPKAGKLKNPALVPVYETADTTVWQNPKCLPRSYIVHGAKIINDDKDEVLDTLFDEHFDPLRTVILESGGSINTGIQSMPQQPQEKVEFLKYSNNEVVIEAELKNDGYLVLSDFNYPGWRADILNLSTGGRKQVIPLYANHVFRAVGLKTGKYSVRFIFQPQSFYRGLKITILTIIIAALGLIWLRLKPRLR